MKQTWLCNFKIQLFQENFFLPFRYTDVFFIYQPYFIIAEPVYTVDVKQVSPVYANKMMVQQL